MIEDVNFHDVSLSVPHWMVSTPRLGLRAIALALRGDGSVDWTSCLAGLKKLTAAAAIVTIKAGTAAAQNTCRALPP